MVRLGAAHGIEARALISPMDEPLGRAVGNALEVQEAVDTLAGDGPPDLRSLALEAAGWLVGDAGRVERALDSGEALDTYGRWIREQGGDPSAPLPQAPVVQEVPAPASGVVTRCSALCIGELAMRLGAGRATKGAPVDHAVGVVVHRRSGERVEAGQPLATLHARSRMDPAEALACFDVARDA